MGFSLYNILKAGLLIVNGVAILHPKRFLSKYALNEIDHSEGATSVKNQAVGLFQAIQYLKAPLIAMNLLVILLELLIGG